MESCEDSPVALEFNSGLPTVWVGSQLLKVFLVSDSQLEISPFGITAAANAISTLLPSL